MKQKVTWNWLAVILTFGVLLLLIVGMMATRDIPEKYFALGGVMLLMLLTLWVFSPTAIGADENSIVVYRRVKKKRIPFSEIKDISYYTPVPFGGIKLCGSGGFGGFWGWYNNSDIGTYFAYYGDPHSCFLVELKNGRKYVLGCENPGVIMDAVKKEMK